jgi:DNA anti-recombination protein RmuC
MKKYLIPSVAILVVLVVGWVAFGQQEDTQRQRFAQFRDAQVKAIEAIQEQLTKLKAAWDEAAKERQAGRDFQNLSEEERTKLRETFTKRREEQQKMVGTIEQQVARLKGPRQLRAEYEDSIKELTTIRDQAVSEKAPGTAGSLDKLIAKKQKQLEDTLQKLGFTTGATR